jgi:hypothetical protein
VASVSAISSDAPPGASLARVAVVPLGALPKRRANGFDISKERECLLKRETKKTYRLTTAINVATKHSSGRTEST